MDPAFSVIVEKLLIIGSLVSERCSPQNCSFKVSTHPSAQPPIYSTIDLSIIHASSLLPTYSPVHLSPSVHPGIVMMIATVVKKIDKALVPSNS